jgi:hypothetical protein
MATTKKPTSKMSAADRKSYAYANSEQKYKETVAKTRVAQDKARKAKELNRKARETAIMEEANTPLFGIDKTGTIFGPSRRQAARDRISAANARETQLRSLDDKNAATLKQAVRNVSVGDAARKRVAAKAAPKKKK